MFSESELRFIRDSLGNKIDAFQPSLSYVYKKQKEHERNKNRYKVRKQLDKLRKEFSSFTPLEVISLKSTVVQNDLGIKDFSGIYIIQNHHKNKFYIGKSKSVFKRVHQHFINAEGNHGVYRDYITGDKFSINFVPLEATNFKTLNEFEDNAIGAYNSIRPNGYNMIGGNILDRSFFLSDSHLKVAQMIMEKIKNTEEFKGLTNDKKRLMFIGQLLRKFDLPNDSNFKLNFMRYIKEIQKESKIRGLDD